MAAVSWTSATRAVAQGVFVATVTELGGGTTESALKQLARCWLRSDAGLVVAGDPNMWSPESLRVDVRAWPRQVATGEREAFEIDSLTNHLVWCGHAAEAAGAFVACWLAAVQMEEAYVKQQTVMSMMAHLGPPTFFVTPTSDDRQPQMRLRRNNRRIVCNGGPQTALSISEVITSDLPL